jgi:hypothetical protein
MILALCPSAANGNTHHRHGPLLKLRAPISKVLNLRLQFVQVLPELAAFGLDLAFYLI